MSKLLDDLIKQSRADTAAYEGVGPRLSIVQIGPLQVIDLRK
jgi:hypothetical protein